MGLEMYWMGGLVKNTKFIKVVYYLYINRKPIFELYSKVYEVNKEDMIEPDLEKYENFLEFFTRKVKPREFDKNENTLVSPADSRVLSFTEIHTVLNTSL